jgi:hypothetical protein
MISLLLAVLLQMIQDTVTPSDINALKQRNINELLQDTYSPFSKLFLDALHLDKHMYGMVSSGTKLASFFDTYYPIVAFSEDFNRNAPHQDLSSNRFFGFKLNDLFKELREVPYSPIDYGLMFSGKPVLLEQISGNQYRNNSLSSQEIRSECKTLFGDFLEQLPPNKRPRFYKHLIHPETDEFDLISGKLM